MKAMTTSQQSCITSCSAVCRSSTDGATSTRRARPGRRPLRVIGASVAAVLVMGVLQLQSATATRFDVGDPINVELNPSEYRVIAFEGRYMEALAISLQQCSGSKYLHMEVLYNDETVVDDSVTSNECNRVVAGGIDYDETTMGYGKLCSFAGLGYRESSYTVEDVEYLDAENITVTITNNGDIKAWAQVVLFTTDTNSPIADAEIDNVNTIASLEENTYTIDIEFDATGPDDEGYCSSEYGCSITAYYLLNEGDSDSNYMFDTSCQAKTGITLYEGSTLGSGSSSSSTAVHSRTSKSTSAFSVTTCLQFPRNVKGRYRVYVVVSRDTYSVARVGYGMEDRLIFASEDLKVYDDMDYECPSIEEQGNSSSDDSSAGVRTITVPARATGVLAVGIAMAATAAVLRAAGY